MSLPAFEDQVKYFNENSPPKEVLTLHSRKLAETDYSERDSSHEAARHVGWQALFELEKLKEKKGGLHGCRCQRVVTLSFVHGNTAHFKLATCEACAKKSKSHIWRTPAPLNARCSVCRQGIERIAKRSSRNLGRKGGGVKKGASVEIP